MPRKDDPNWRTHQGDETESLDVEATKPRWSRGRGWTPRVDVFETDTQLVVRADIAAVSPTEIRVNLDVDNHVLTIRGIRRDEVCNGSEACRFHLMEVLFGEFERRVNLPPIELKETELKATYRNGFLFVVIEKGEATVRVTTEVWTVIKVIEV